MVDGKYIMIKHKFLRALLFVFVLLTALNSVSAYYTAYGNDGPTITHVGYVKSGNSRYAEYSNIGPNGGISISYGKNIGPSYYYPNWGARYYAYPSYYYTQPTYYNAYHYPRYYTAYGYQRPGINYSKVYPTIFA